MTEKKLQRSMGDAGRELKNMLVSMNRLVPSVVVIIAALSVWLIVLSLGSLKAMMGIAVILVFAVAVAIYARTANYGESALALVAGLLTVYSVEWTGPRFAVFVTVWTVFSLLVLIIGSVKLAARMEEVISDAAYFAFGSRAKPHQAELKAITEDKGVTMLGPIEKAEVLRVFAFRKIPIQNMPSGLRATEVLSIVTGADHESMAHFVADIEKMFGAAASDRYARFLARVPDVIRDSPVSPADFIRAFQDSRHLALSGALSPEDYFDSLRTTLESGIRPDDVCKALSNKGALSTPPN